MKRTCAILAVSISMMFLLVPNISIIGAEETEDKYAYLEDMSIKELKELDNAIHKLLPKEDDDNRSNDNDSEMSEEESMLNASKWMDIASDRELVFDDGILKLTTDDGYYEYEYSVNENEIVYKYNGLFGDSTVKLLIEDNNDIKTIVNSDKSSHQIYVREEDYDYAKNNIKIPQDEVFVEIGNKAGGKVETSGWKLLKLSEENAIDLQSRFIGSKVVVISAIKEINGPTTYDGRKLNYGYIELEGGWIVEIPDKESANNIKLMDKGDLVEASGKLYEVFAGKLKVYDTYSIKEYEE